MPGVFTPFAFSFGILINQCIIGIHRRDDPVEGPAVANTQIVSKQRVFEFMDKFVIVGIGQDMRGDDAAGLEAVRLWQKNFPETAADPRVRVEQAGMPGLDLIELLANADGVLLVDAVQSGSAPGTLHMVKPEQVASFDGGTSSAHGWGVAETLALARELRYPLPDQIVILGIEATSFTVGEPLSKPVTTSLVKAAEMIEERLHWWFVL
jgi:hydrogenase maturation protease